MKYTPILLVSLALAVASTAMAAAPKHGKKFIIGMSQSPIPNSIQNCAEAGPDVWIGCLFQGFSKMAGWFGWTSHLQPNAE